MENQEEKKMAPENDAQKAASDSGGTMRIEPSSEMLSRLKNKMTTQEEKKDGLTKEESAKVVKGVVKTSGKTPVFFKMLIMLSYIFFVAGIIVGVIALLDVPVPEFMLPVINFIGKIFIA